MGFWEFVAAWYNVLFLAPLLLVFLFAILQLIGVSLQIGGGSEADVDVDMDADTGIEVESDVDVDADLTSEPGIITSALGFLNVGKVPLTVILMTWLASLGVVGLICNGVIGDEAIRAVPPLAGISFGVAFVVSIVSTKYFAAGIAKIFPESEPATTDLDLIGRQARVTSGSVTPTFGRAIVQTPSGYRLTIACRIREGEEIPVQGDEVLLADYDPAMRTFEVIKVDTKDF
jgi:hypothetical protein